MVFGNQESDSDKTANTDNEQPTYFHDSPGGMEVARLEQYLRYLHFSNFV